MPRGAPSARLRFRAEEVEREAECMKTHSTFLKTLSLLLAAALAAAGC